MIALSRPLRQDALLAGAAFLALAGGVLLERGTLGWPPVLASLALSLPLVLRRRYPVGVALVCAVIAFLGTGLPGWSGRTVTAAAFCSAVYHRRDRFALVVTLSLTWTVLYGLAAPAPPATPFITEALLLGLSPIAAGTALRLHRERVESAASLRRAELGRMVADERLRIARDVHDAVGHHLTAIRLQAMAGSRVPTAAAGALERITELSATALTETRELLAALREEPGLDRLPELAARLGHGGPRITVRGADTPVPELLGQHAYRIVQESLTNAVRHAGASQIEVAVRRNGTELEITVSDNGSGGPASTSDGHGLRGLRERAELLGGSCAAGPANSGWRVHAVLPWVPR
ncbi:sensor histidine kinase [Crossiella sp. CA198]|uniref:sensor histidine kinase n=1 Tax=Crossiella sp. CA198 TaxID=3455607 RepID=UPI003F8D1BB2